MIGRTSLLRATALSLSLGLAATAAHAASIADVAKQNDELSTFSEAITAAGLDQQLSGEGPFTVFAPTNRAFEQLPKGALDELMKEENQAQLTKLVEHHVVQGEAIAADELLGRQTRVETMSGDTLTLDGTSEAVLLVPTGLTIAKIGDQLVIEREGVAVSTHAIEVEDQVVRKAGEQPQVQGQQPQEELAAAETTPTAEPSDMPMTEHQQQALQSEPGQEQQQTAAAGGTDMPATEHQRQALAEEELPGEQQQAYEQPRVEGRPDILREASVVATAVQADNGVIHMIDAVLVPQSVLETLEGEGRG